MALSSLVDRCARRFVSAADLVGVKGREIERLRRSRYEGGTDLSRLLEGWDVLCTRYRRERYDAQASLIEDHGDQETRRWSEFLYWELFPSLEQEDEFVRNVLRAVELLPSRSPARAAAAIRHHLQEITLVHEPSARVSEDTDGNE
jgi:DNA-binding GntR family transcriptional regulator